MKKLILYARRNTGMIILPYLVAKGYEVKVISDDKDVVWVANDLGCEMITMEEIGNDFDLFICVHGDKIIPKNLLVKDRMINVHPCLRWYPGHNPIKRYIENKNIIGSVEVQYLIEKVDAGEFICAEIFKTPVCHTYQDFYNIALPYYTKVISMALKLLKV